MTTRRYDLNTGIETSSTPTVSDPSGSNDIMSKGYADKTYAAREYWGHSVADTTALKAIGTTGDNQRYDRQIVLKDDDSTLWKFDAASSATEDGTTVIQPNSGTGRWLIASGGTGGTSGGASGLESLQNKLESEGFGIKTRELDNSIGNSANDVPLHTFFTGYLIENYTSGGASINVVWNPVVLNDSDKQYDSATGYSATGAGASLSATAGSNKVGSNKYTFDKNGTSTEAGVRYDRGAQTLSVGGNYRVWFWINIPSTTNLSNVGLRMYADTTSNFRTWTKTTDYAGNALTTGWNLIFVDISDTTGSTTGGTGWTYTTLSRYQEFFVTASSAAQTYSAILFDGMFFSHGAISEVNFNSLEMTGFDNSNKNNFVLDTSNTRYDGPLTLDATVAQSYTAGISNANATQFKRSTLSWSTGGSIGFDTSLTSGAIALDQEVRLVRQFRESLSGNLSAFVDMYTPQVYKVTAVGGSTIDVEDPADTTANLKNGNEIHIFERIINAGEITFAHRATRSMTADATHSSGTTTITVSPTSIAVGDFVVKQQLTTRASLVAKSSDESFTTMSYDTSPNGVQLINQGRAVPNPNFVYASWSLGSGIKSLALSDRSGNGRNLTEVGTVNTTSDFLRARYSASGWTTSNYLRTAGTTGPQYDGLSELIQVSFWLFHNGTDGTFRQIISARSYTPASGTDYRGWNFGISASANTSSLQFYNSSSTPSATNVPAAFTSGAWHHVVLQVQSGVICRAFVNGAAPAATVGTIANINAAQALYIGATPDSNTLDTSMIQAGTSLRIADMIIWRDGPLLTDAQITSLYNAGAPVPTGFFPVVRNEYELTGQSGQKLSMKANLTRTTSAVSPQILDMGVIKT